MSFNHNNGGEIAATYDNHCLGGLDVEAAIDRALEQDDGDREQLIASVLAGSDDEGNLIRDSLAIILNGNSPADAVMRASASLHKYGSRAVRRTVLHTEG